MTAVFIVVASFLYLARMRSTSGWSLCILRMLFMLDMLSGWSTTRTRVASPMIATP